MNTTLATLKAAYERLTGYAISYRTLCDYRERAWYEYLHAGYTVEDLTLVVTWLKAKIAKGERNPGALKFSNLIVQLDHYDEDLQMARAEKRNARPTAGPRERALSQLRPAAPASAATTITARPIAEVIAAMRRAAQ